MQNFKKFDNNSVNNDLYLIRRIDGEINEIHSKILDLCRNNLVILCDFKEYYYSCTRVCISTGVIIEFTMEFLTFEEEHTNIIRFMYQGEDNSYNFFQKTMNQILVHEEKEELLYSSFTSLLTSEEIEQEWLNIARHFNTSTGLRVVKSLALANVHVPQEVLDVIVSSCKKVTLDFLVCIIAIFKNCKNYTLNRSAIYDLLVDASNNNELYKHQVAILLYLWKTQGITYGDGINVQSECSQTKRIINQITLFDINE